MVIIMEQISFGVSYHLHDEVTTNKALLCRLLETGVLLGKDEVQDLFLSVLTRCFTTSAKLLVPNSECQKI